MVCLGLLACVAPRMPDDVVHTTDAGTAVPRMPDDVASGTYSISLMRLVGDTFEFHALYRSLRERLQDLTTPAAPLAAQS